MMQTGLLFLAVVLIVGVPISLLLLVQSRWQERRFNRMDRKARQMTAKQLGVSYAYTDEVIENNKRFARGEITQKQWMQQAMSIAYRYPQDSRILALLQEEEGL